MSQNIWRFLIANWLLFEEFNLSLLIVILTFFLILKYSAFIDWAATAIFLWNLLNLLIKIFFSSKIVFSCSVLLLSGSVRGFFRKLLVIIVWDDSIWISHDFLFRLHAIITSVHDIAEIWRVQSLWIIFLGSSCI